MSKFTVIGVLMVVVLIAVFGYIIVNDIQFDAAQEDSNNESVTMLSDSKGGVVVEYPSNWVLSNSTSNDSIIAVSKGNSVDSFQIGQVNVNVEKRGLDEGFDSFLNRIYTNIGADPAFQLVSSGDISVNGHDAVEYIYTSSSVDGSVRQHKAIWFEKNNCAYVIMYSAPVDQFEANLPAADYIIEHININ